MNRASSFKNIVYSIEERKKLIAKFPNVPIELIDLSLHNLGLKNSMELFFNIPVGINGDLMFSLFSTGSACFIDKLIFQPDNKNVLLASLLYSTNNGQYKICKKVLVSEVVLKKMQTPFSNTVGILSVNLTKIGTSTYIEVVDIYELISEFDVNTLIIERNNMSDSEWIRLLARSVGINPHMQESVKCLLSFLGPLVEDNIVLVNDSIDITSVPGGLIEYFRLISESKDIRQLCENRLKNKDVIVKDFGTFSRKDRREFYDILLQKRILIEKGLQQESIRRSYLIDSSILMSNHNFDKHNILDVIDGVVSDFGGLEYVPYENIEDDRCIYSMIIYNFINYVRERTFSKSIDTYFELAGDRKEISTVRRIYSMLLKILCCEEPSMEKAKILLQASKNNRIILNKTISKI